jgi:hypothetical protein
MSLNLATNSQHITKQFPTKISPREYDHRLENLPLKKQISHPERLLTGLKTCLFNRKNLDTKHKFLTNFFVDKVIIVFSLDHLTPFYVQEKQ